MSKKAQESRSIQKARKKLEEQLGEERKLFNPEKLREISEQIYRWIDRHSGERVSLKEKNIQLFDENQHPVHTASTFILGLRQDLTGEEPQDEEANSLRGRIVSTADEPKKG